jgi:hypothetical protein
LSLLLVLRVALGLVLAALPATAQQAVEPAPPPGGWPLRRVKVLRAVPLPPGGLVPYRKGSLWGFCDTTGRVWLRPVFQVEPHGEAFAKGLLAFSDLHLTGRWPPEWRDFRAENQYVCNARGELLRSPWRHPRAFVVQPDSSLVAVRRVQATGKPALRIETDPTLVEGANWAFKPLTNQTPPRLLRAPYTDSEADVESLGGGYYAAARRQWWRPARRLRYRSGNCGETSTLVIHGYTHRAVFDATGRRTTRFRYESISRLVAGTLLVGVGEGLRASRDWELRNGRTPVRERETPTRFGLITPQGRPLLPIRYASLKRLGHDRLEATEEVNDQIWYSRLTSRGEVVRARQTEPFAVGDTAGCGRPFAPYVRPPLQPAPPPPPPHEPLPDTTAYVLTYSLIHSTLGSQYTQTQLTLTAPDGRGLYASDSAYPAALGFDQHTPYCDKSRTIRRALTVAEATGRQPVICEALQKFTPLTYKKKVRLLDINGNVIGSPPYSYVTALGGGWYWARLDTGVSPGPPPDLFGPDGCRWPCPDGAHWQPRYEERFRDKFERPFARGVMRTSKGYVTRGGRPLWQD